MYLLSSFQGENLGTEKLGNLCKVTQPGKCRSWRSQQALPVPEPMLSYISIIKSVIRAVLCSVRKFEQCCAIKWKHCDPIYFCWYCLTACALLPGWKKAFRSIPFLLLFPMMTLRTRGFYQPFPTVCSRGTITDCLWLSECFVTGIVNSRVYYPCMRSCNPYPGSKSPYLTFYQEFLLSLVHSWTRVAGKFFLIWPQSVLTCKSQPFLLYSLWWHFHWG